MKGKEVMVRKKKGRITKLSVMALIFVLLAIVIGLLTESEEEKAERKARVELRKENKK